MRHETLSAFAELVFLTTVKLQLLAVLIGQVKRITQNGKRDSLRFQHPKDVPYLRVQKRIASRDIKVRKATAHLFAHFHAAVNHLLCSLDADRKQLGMAFGEDVTVLATLVAIVGDVPLE